MSRGASVSDLRVAIDWLDANEGQNGERESCLAAAAYLERELGRRARELVKRAAKTAVRRGEDLGAFVGAELTRAGYSLAELERAFPARGAIKRPTRRAGLAPLLERTKGAK